MLRRIKVLALCLFAITQIAIVDTARAEDGYDLWLRYQPLEAPLARDYKRSLRRIAHPENPSQTIAIARDELVRGLTGLLGEAPEQSSRTGARGTLLIGTPAAMPAIAALNLPLSEIGPEGFLIKSEGNRTIITAQKDVGVLYGVFHFLRLVQTGASISDLDIAETPAHKVRILNHWDNLDRHVERGYAGQSIWDWHKLPGYLYPRYTDYARANASLGINGVSLTNVNANSTVLTPLYIKRTAALADLFRPYGIKVYLTARFSAPIEIGGLKTADPLNADVQAWWKSKADEIYAAIPDFGGFLVKANSEGQPGPNDYDRNHADGANMLADAVVPHGGIVMWRAFVYSDKNPEDRHKQANAQFEPIDGQFRDNVLVQAKNGAIDFQPREPFHPLFGATPETNVMMEFQITKEYLGFATHLVYKGTLYEEALDADTYAKGPGSSVAKVVDGTLFDQSLTGMAGVANIGTDRNWSGSHFDQANWFAFGRLAWNNKLDAESIARDWVKMTFSRDPRFLEPVLGMMMGSRQATVDYMTPLGLGHLMATGHHYGPAPWVSELGRPEWNPVYYHRADKNGIGFDRTPSGSNALEQYHAPLPAQWGDPATVPEEFLLWFHHLPWDYKTKSGRTLWAELVHRYTDGVAKVTAMRQTWAGLEGMIDAERFNDVAAFLAIHEKEAKWWRDACLAYFASVNGLAIPDGYAPPEHSLEHYKSLTFPSAPGN